jgi:uncharacterized protein
MDRPILLTQEFSLSVDNLQIRGEMMWPKTGGQRPAVVICHGIPQRKQDPSTRNEGYKAIARFFAERQYFSIIFNFRGTGFSEGSFDLWGWRRDLDKVLDFVIQQENVDRQLLSVLGFSGGAATTCITMAQRQEAANVILAACPADFDFLFDRQPTAELLEEARSIGIMRKEDLPEDLQKWSQDGKRCFGPSIIHQISPRPLLLIHGQQDDLVLPRHAHRLYEAAREPKELIMLPEAPHQLRTDPHVLDLCLGWLAEMNKKKSKGGHN